MAAGPSGVEPLAYGLGAVAQADVEWAFRDWVSISGAAAATYYGYVNVTDQVGYGLFDTTAGVKDGDPFLHIRYRAQVGTNLGAVLGQAASGLKLLLGYDIGQIKSLSGSVGSEGITNRGVMLSVSFEMGKALRYNDPRLGDGA